MASVGAVRPAAGFRNDTSTSGDAGRLPNEMSNMSLRDDQVTIFLERLNTLMLLSFGGWSVPNLVSDQCRILKI